MLQMIIAALKNDLIHQVITGFDPDITESSSSAVMEFREPLPSGHVFAIEHHPNLTAFAKHHLP
jgi:hypothetical protein